MCQDLQILEVSARELSVCNNLNLPITNILDRNNIAQVSYPTIDLNLILKELLEGGDIEDLVGGWLRGIDDVLFPVSLMRPTIPSLPIAERGGRRGGEYTPYW